LVWLTVGAHPRPLRHASDAAGVGYSALLASVASVTVLHMKLAIELPLAQAEKLRAEAERLGLAPEELARAALSDLLSTPDPEFQDVARRVVAKNQDLYKRLA
jgi:hypothetical protein